MSNAAALQIITVSTDVLFHTSDDVFVTGMCRAVNGISCISVPGFPRRDRVVTDCDLVSGRIFGVHNVTSVQQMSRLWILVNTVADQECSSKLSTLYVIVVCAALLSVIYCFSIYRRKLFLLLL